MSCSLGSVCSGRGGVRLSESRARPARRSAGAAAARRSDRVQAAKADLAGDLRPALNGRNDTYSPGTLAVHGGEREGRPRISDSLTTPIVQTSTYTFKDTKELIAYQEGNYGSYEYGR